jgi:hypothetical protein
VTPLLAFAPDRFAPGVERPGHAQQTYDWREPAGATGNTAEILDGYTAAPIAEAFSRVYSSDAHLVTYVLHRDGEPLAHQPRLNKSCLPWLREQGFEPLHSVLLFDIDNPGHREHGALDHEIWARRLRAELPEYGFYFTSKGVRLVVQLDRWVVPETAEEMLETVFGDLERRGFTPDRACRDWTRHYRLPHVRRAGADYRSPVVDISTLRPQTIAPTPIVRRHRAGGPARSVARFQQTLPLAWASRVERLGDLLRGGYEGRRHDVALALSGALLSLQVPPELLPAIVSAVVVRAGWRNPRLHEQSAVDTVERWQSRDVVTGLSALRWLAPPVADAVDVIGSATAEERARTENDAPAPPTLPVDVAVSQIQSEIRAAYGLVLLRAQCGLGKSHAARVVAAERAHAVKPDAKRIASSAKTGFSVPNHKLAVQHAEYLRSEGVAVQRVFGVLSVKRPDGKHECHYAEQAQCMRGGQSIPRVFCQGNGRNPCEYRDTCSAYGGVEGPDDARVTVGPHALLSQIESAIGQNGVLIIDEPPDLLETQEFTIADFEAAIRNTGYFSRRYVCAMAPALDVVHRWLIHTQELDAREKNLSTALAAEPSENVWVVACGEVGTGVPIEAARLAFDEQHEPRLGYAPPIEPHHIDRLRTDRDVARNIGDASRVLRALWNVCQEGAVYATRVEERSTKHGSKRVLLITGMRQELADALGASHPTVVLDANADLQVPIYQRVIAARELGGVPRDIDALALRFRYREFYAQDGAHVERTMVMWGASRKAWFIDGQLTDGFVNAVERAVRWALEQPSTQRVCLVSFVGVEVALRAAQGDATAAQAWESMGQDPAALPVLVERLRPVLARLPGTLELAHYGAIRGLDHWRDCDALVTLGDPIQNLGSVRHDAAFIGLPDPDARVHGLARAELEQAHGRLRTVHRSKPARMLHIGRVLPGGWHGARILGRSRAEDWARGGEMGREHGIKGAAYGILGKEFGVLGKEHGIKGAEHGAKGAEFGALGAEAGAVVAAQRRNESDMTSDEVKARVEALGGERAAIEALGITERTLRRYRNGERSIPQELADKLRMCAGSHRTGPPGGPLPDGEISLISSIGTPAAGGPVRESKDAAE